MKSAQFTKLSLSDSESPVRWIPAVANATVVAMILTLLISSVTGASLTALMKVQPP